MPFNPPTAFQPITNLFFLTEVMSVNPSLNVNTMKELVELSKTRPQGLNYASPANGVTLFMEKFKKDTGANFTMVPYRGGGDAVNAVLGGDVPVGFFGMGNSIGNLTSGKLKALAVDSPQRSPLLPNVPTFAEAGYTGVLNRAWFGMFAPADTPKPIVAKLHAEITRIAKAPEFTREIPHRPRPRADPQHARGVRQVPRGGPRPRRRAGEDLRPAAAVRLVERHGFDVRSDARPRRLFTLPTGERSRAKAPGEGASVVRGTAPLTPALSPMGRGSSQCMRHRLCLDLEPVLVHAPEHRHARVRRRTACGSRSPTADPRPGRARAPVATPSGVVTVSPKQPKPRAIAA